MAFRCWTAGADGLTKTASPRSRKIDYSSLGPTAFKTTSAALLPLALLFFKSPVILHFQLFCFSRCLDKAVHHFHRHLSHKPCFLASLNHPAAWFPLLQLASFLNNFNACIDRPSRLVIYWCHNIFHRTKEGYLTICKASLRCYLFLYFKTWMFFKTMLWLTYTDPVGPVALQQWRRKMWVLNVCCSNGRALVDLSACFLRDCETNGMERAGYCLVVDKMRCCVNNQQSISIIRSTKQEKCRWDIQSSFLFSFTRPNSWVEEAHPCFSKMGT